MGAPDCPVSELGRTARKAKISIFWSIGLAQLPRQGKISTAVMTTVAIVAQTTRDGEEIARSREGGSADPTHMVSKTTVDSDFPQMYRQSTKKTEQRAQRKSFKCVRKNGRGERIRTSDPPGPEPTTDVLSCCPV